MKQIWIIAALGLCLSGRYAFAWEPQYPEPLKKLILMDDNALDSEAMRVCVKAVVSRQYGMDGTAIATTDYLETVVHVTRTKHHGQEPWWMTAYKGAAEGTDAQQCNAIAMKRMNEEVATASAKREGKLSRHGPGPPVIHTSDLIGLVIWSASDTADQYRKVRMEKYYAEKATETKK
jgi:hypothetical protein